MDKLRFKAKFDTTRMETFIKRISTGIPGLDSMIDGGIPKRFLTTLTCPPGTGKTTLGMQFLLEGTEHHEKCLLFSYEEDIKQLVKHCTRFGWDLGKYLNDGYLKIFGLTRLTSEEITDIIEAFKPERIVFDSVSLRRHTQPQTHTIMEKRPENHQNKRNHNDHSNRKKTRTRKERIRRLRLHKRRNDLP